MYNAYDLKWEKIYNTYLIKKTLINSYTFFKVSAFMVGKYTVKCRSLNLKNV